MLLLSGASWTYSYIQLDIDTSLGLLQLDLSPTISHISGAQGAF